MQGPTTTGKTAQQQIPTLKFCRETRGESIFLNQTTSRPSKSTSLQVTKSSGAALKANGATATASIFAPTPPTPPAPDSLFVPPAPPPAPPVPNTLVVPVDITAVAPAQNNASSINIAGTAEANDSVTLSNKGNVVGTTTADSGGHWSINGIPLSDGADYSFTATATDAQQYQRAFECTEFPQRSKCAVGALIIDDGGGTEQCLLNQISWHRRSQ